MTKPKPQKRETVSTHAIIVLGLDVNGKPKAGRFAKQHATAARKAARSLKLAACQVDRPNLATIAAKLPTGRIHSTGKAFLPYVKQGLYDELAAAARPATSKTAAATQAHPRKAMYQARARPKAFIVLGFDEDLKPRGARYQNPNEEHLTKLASEAKLNLYELRSTSAADLAASLPIGRLPATA